VKRDIWCLVAFRTCRGVAAGLINIAFPYLILRQLHATPLALGLLYTAGSFGTAVIGLVCGFLADLLGRKFMLGILGALLPASALLVYLSTSQWVLFAATFIGGFSATGSLASGGVGGAAMPVQSAVLADVTNADERTVWFARFAFLSGVTGAAGALAARVVPVRPGFLVACVIAAAGTLALVPIRSSRPAREVLRLPSLGTISRFTITGVLNGFSQGLVTPFLIPFFVIVYHVPREQMSVAAFLSGLIASAAMLAAAPLERAFGWVQSIVLTRAVGIVLFVLFPLVRALPVSLAIYMLAPALRVIAAPIQQSVMSEMVLEEERSRALGINQVARLTSASTGTVLTGYLFHIAAVALPFYLYAAVAGGNLFLYRLFFGGTDSAGHSAAAAERRAGPTIP
jgi:MFS family permease